MDTLCEMYKGTYTLTKSEQGPAKTVLTYDVTMVAKSAGQTAELNSLVTSTILDAKLPHLQTVSLPSPVTAIASPNKGSRTKGPGDFQNCSGCMIWQKVFCYRDPCTCMSASWATMYQACNRRVTCGSCKTDSCGTLTAALWLEV